MGLYEELISECINWIDIGIFLRFLNEVISIDGGIPLSKIPKFISRTIQHVS